MHKIYKYLLLYNGTFLCSTTAETYSVNYRCRYLQEAVRL